MEINKGIEAFDDRLDTTRTNPDRKPFGKSDGQHFSMGDEYDVKAPVAAPGPPKVDPPAAEKKFTHKLANGTTLEAASVEELAGLIEKSFQQATPAPVDFEDKPLYQPIEFKRKELSLAEQANILNVWKENPQNALRMLEEAEYGHPLETILKTLTIAEQRELNRRQEEAGAEFLGECEDFNPTPANGKKLTAYLKEKQKPITKHNLLVAFQQLSATDKALVRKVDVVPPNPEDELHEAAPPPTIVPSNQGRTETAAQGTVDAAKFAALPLDKQKQFFADLRRRQ